MDQNLLRYIGNFATNNKQSYIIFQEWLIGKKMSDFFKGVQFPFAFNDIFEEKKMQNIGSILSKLPNDAANQIGPRLEELTGKLIHVINTKLSPAFNYYQHYKYCNLHLLKYVLNYQPSFQKMESIAALPAKHDFSHYAFIEILNYFTEHKATSLHIEATSKIATTHDYGSIKFAYTLSAFIHNNPSPFQMNLVNDILIKHAYAANHIAKISEYLVQYNPTKLQAYSAIDIAIQHDKSYDPVYFGNILKYFYYIDILYFLTLLKDIFLNDICNAVFEDKSNSHENCLIAGDIVSITAIIPCAMSTPKTSLAH